MKNRLFALMFMAVTAVSCDDDFLEKPPLDSLTDDTFWSSESNVRTFSYGFYTDYFTGYGTSAASLGMHWTGNNQVLSDDRAPGSPVQFPINVPSSGGGWGFGYVRKANIMINRVENMTVLKPDAKGHWTGVGRFFRGLEYYDLVRRFGDVPYYDYVPETSDLEALYKPRDSRTFVMDQVLLDFKYAAENVRTVSAETQSGGSKGRTINKDIVMAYMARVFLFEGTWQKYHLNNSSKAKEYLEASKWASEQIINDGAYRLDPDYRSVFTSFDLASNPEVILYRQYVEGISTHATMSYNNKEAQSGASKDLIQSYVTKNGLPIFQTTGNPEYKGDKGIDNVMANRDPRLSETIVDSVRLLSMKYDGKVVYNYSTSGYVSHKYLEETTKSETTGNGQQNITDAPILRYGEVLINYAEAAAELATVGGPAFTDADLDKSINVLRKRFGAAKAITSLSVNGDQALAGGVVIDDPKRDPTVSPILWEIRRERRSELVFEGFRFDDLRRWKKLEYTDTEANPIINRGAWVSKDNPAYKLGTVRLSPDNVTPPSTSIREGYVVPSFNPTGIRIFDSEKYYLYALPTDQINLYKSEGYELMQNPGW